MSRRAFVSRIAVVAVSATVMFGAPASAGQPVGRVTAQVTIEHRGSGRPSLVRVRLDPPTAAGGGELLLSIYNGEGVINRHALQPVAPGVYQDEYVFPQGGLWRYYMRFGPGQAGFASADHVSITPEAGTVDTFSAVFRNDLARAPGFVQPLGYAAFGLIASLALAGVSAILVWLAHRATAPSG